MSDAVTELAIDLWNADHPYMQGIDRKLWDMNMEEGGLPADFQRRYLMLAALAIKGGPVISKDGRTVSHRSRSRANETTRRVERLEDAMRAILVNTEDGAIRHRDYDHLANDIADTARAALDDAPLEEGTDPYVAFARRHSERDDLPPNIARTIIRGLCARLERLDEPA